MVLWGLAYIIDVFRFVVFLKQTRGHLDKKATIYSLVSQIQFEFQFLSSNLVVLAIIVEEWAKYTRV